MENDPNTNMIVVTNKRVYNFELQGHEPGDIRDSSLSFGIRFRYPEDELAQMLEEAKQQEVAQAAEVVPQKTVSPDDLNFSYSYRGSDEIAPIRVFDDGEFTYFQFAHNIDTPAIFLVDSDRQESIVNYHVRGKYVVVQRINAQFMLRSDQQATCVYNDAFKLGQASTLPHADTEVEG